MTQVSSALLTTLLQTWHPCFGDEQLLEVFRAEHLADRLFSSTFNLLWASVQALILR